MSVFGEVDVATSDVLFETLVDALADARTDRVEVDLSALTLLDASGVGVLLAAQNRARTNGKHLEVSGASGVPLRVLEITGVLKYFTST